MLLPLSSLFLAIGISLPLSSSSLSSSPSPPSPAAKSNYRYDPNIKNYDMHITSLHRYAVKGLSGDSLDSVTFQEGDGTFEDDRRFALLYDDRTECFNQDDPEWLHKDNFLCAFTAPELLASLRTEYKVDPNHDGRRLLTVWNRDDDDDNDNSTPLLSADLASSGGRDATSTFFSDLCGKKVVCVCASDVVTSSTSESTQHTHQFGNTSSGVKNNNGDTRTIHIVNSNTVKQFSDAMQHDLKQQKQKQHEGNGIQLNPTRFRPNIIVDGLDPWSEFDLIGKTIEVIPKESDQEHQTQQQAKLRFRITSRTVRCACIGVDPLQPELGTIDIPKLLTKHFPQYGPYLGVYALVDQGCGFNCGQLCVGDIFRVVDE
jgi:uncharacterized protein YcbX